MALKDTIKACYVIFCSNIPLTKYVLNDKPKAQTHRLALFDTNTAIRLMSYFRRIIVFAMFSVYQFKLIILPTKVI